MSTPNDPHEELPPDEAERARIRSDLHHTLFVEAGAGSGKTTSLVDRVLQLVLTGTAELRQIAAITFTEKAGAELRDRIRKALTEEASRSAVPEVEARCTAALDQLDGAAIGTLHSFAQRILAENPVEAGLPPRVEVLDEVRSNLAFERRWERDRDTLLGDPALERAILLLEATDVRFESLRALAVAFDENWDLVAQRVPADPPPLPSVRDLAGPLLTKVREVCRYRAECSDAGDKLVVRLDALSRLADSLGEIDDDFDLLAEMRGEGTLDHPGFRPGNAGSKDAWGGAEVKKSVADAIRGLESEFAKVVGQVADACARVLASAICRLTLAAVQTRRESGLLTFHDLLVMARELLTHPEHGSAVRCRLHDRYQRLLLDEFQDTDPIQVELAVRIAAADPEAAGSGTLPWHEVEVAPGHLFFVGDPKQSIYRFRRADISVFLAARQRFGGEQGEGLVSLSTNFRSGTPLIHQVNQIFAELMGEGAGGPDDPDLPVPSQPAYAALQPRRPEPPVGPAVAVVGREAADGADGGTTAGEMRAIEAEQVAAAVARAHIEGWSVRAGRDGWRPARLGDITILLPARTSLPFLEEALDARNIAYRAESSSLVYHSRAIRDLLITLRAADDPTDHLAIVSALRTPLFGCGDDDLFRFKVEQRGHWGYLGDQPETVEPGPVADGLAYLRQIHDARHWSAPAELLDRIARDRRLFELGFAEGRTRDVWRRLRYVIDQARAWSEASPGGTREYLRWVAHQTADGARVAEAVLPETDDDAVRIMTIHAAKGLEFPITIVSGMSTAPKGQRAAAEVVFPPAGGVGYHFGRNVQTDEFLEWQPLDEQMSHHERIRLLYVACTRAEDHLVVSVQRKVRSKPAESESTLTNAELLVQGLGDHLDLLPDAVPEQIEGVELEPPLPPPAPRSFDEWRGALHEALARGSRPTTVAATALTDEGTPDAGAHVVTPPGQVDPSLDVSPEPPSESPSDSFSGRAEEPDGDPTPALDDGRLFDPDQAPVDPVDPVPVDPVPVDASAGAGGAPDGGEPVAAGLQKRPRDLDLPPWLKGRYGTAVGRAVHGVLQTIDLATGNGLDAAVASQCEAEAIPGRRDDVSALARLALESPTIAAAAAGPHWREVYACTPVGDRMLEGYIDLLHRSPDGLVVVDYKTSGSSDPAELAERVEGYRLQGAAYALTVAATTGEPVVRVTFLFLTPAGAVAIDLPDLEASLAEVERLVREGSELVIA